MGGSLPFVGGSIGEVVGLVIAAPLAKRRDDWLESLAKRLLESQAKVEGFTVENLGQDPQFVSTVMQASAVALRSHSERKLEALRNAVVNIAMRPQIDEAELQMFLGWVDQFTEWHLALLALLVDPAAWARRNSISLPEPHLGGSRAQMLEAALPELRGRRDFYDQVVRDLHARGLLAVESLHGMVTGGGMVQPLGTDIAHRFIAYVSRAPET